MSISESQRHPAQLAATTAEPPAPSQSPEPWKHPAELEFMTHLDWSQDKMIRYLRQNAFSVPARPANASKQAFIKIVNRKNHVTHLPAKYRVPLMFVAKFWWESLRLVLNSESREEEWNLYRMDILHLERLCTRLFEEARAATGTAGNIADGQDVGSASTSGGLIPTSASASSSRTGGSRGKNVIGTMDRDWRCPTFDRALTRFWHKWMVSREQYVKEFWEDYGEEEFQIDVLKRGVSH